MARDRRLVALALPPSAGFVAAWDQIWAEGDAVLPLRPDLPAAVQREVAARLRPDVWWDRDGRRATPGPSAPLDARTDMVVQTSGSSGAPKGVSLSRAALDASARATLERLEAGPEDAWLCCLPLDHLAGLQVVHRARLCGAPLFLHERFDPAAIAAADAAFVSLVPTMLHRLLEHGVDLSGYRAVLVGGAALDDELAQRADAAGVPLVQTYGMTETAGGCVYDGRPLPGVDVDISALGLIRLRGPMLFHQYHLDPDATEAALQNGWFTTTDVGSWDGQRLTLQGRADDVVISGGENVSLAQVAALVAGHPAVAEAAACGLPDREWGEVIAVAVVLRPGASLDLAELRAHVTRQAPPHLAPRRMAVLDELPRTGLGKINRALLRLHCADSPSN